MASFSFLRASGFALGAEDAAGAADLAAGFAASGLAAGVAAGFGVTASGFLAAVSSGAFAAGGSAPPTDELGGAAVSVAPGLPLPCKRSSNSSNSESVIRSLSPPPADGADAAGDSGVAVFSGSSGAGASGLFDEDESPGFPFP